MHCHCNNSCAVIGRRHYVTVQCFPNYLGIKRGSIWVDLKCIRKGIIIKLINRRFISTVVFSQPKVYLSFLCLKEYFAFLRGYEHLSKSFRPPLANLHCRFFWKPTMKTNLDRDLHLCQITPPSPSKIASFLHLLYFLVFFASLLCTPVFWARPIMKGGLDESMLDCWQINQQSRQLTRRHCQRIRDVCTK